MAKDQSAPTHPIYLITSVPCHMLCYDIHIITMQVSPADWEAYVAEIAGDILYEQSPKSLYLVSGVAAMRDRASSYVGMAG